MRHAGANCSPRLHGVVGAHFSHARPRHTTASCAVPARTAALRCALLRPAARRGCVSCRALVDPWSVNTEVRQKPLVCRCILCRLPPVLCRSAAAALCRVLRRSCLRRRFFLILPSCGSSAEHRRATALWRRGLPPSPLVTWQPHAGSAARAERLPVLAGVCGCHYTGGNLRSAARRAPRRGVTAADTRARRHAAKNVYHTSLANVDWLHGSAESLLTVTNVIIVLGLRGALAATTGQHDNAQPPSDSQ